MPRAAKTRDHRVGSMSSQVPVWFWRRMSRLMADQENRGSAGVPDSGEEGSVMRVNLAEGCEAVNHETRRVKRERCETGATRTDGSPPVSLVLPVSPVSLVMCGWLCSSDAFLYKNDCARH